MPQYVNRKDDIALSHYCEDGHIHINCVMMGRDPYDFVTDQVYAEYQDDPEAFMEHADIDDNSDGDTDRIIEQEIEDRTDRLIGDDEEIREFIEHIRGRMSRLDLDQPLYRGIRQTVDFNVGDVITSEAFTSTSTSPKIATAFGTRGTSDGGNAQTFIEINNSNKTDVIGLPTNPDEHEIILDAGTQWKVVDVHNDVSAPDGWRKNMLIRKYVIVELVDPNTSEASEIMADKKYAGSREVEDRIRRAYNDEDAYELTSVVEHPHFVEAGSNNYGVWEYVQGSSDINAILRGEADHLSDYRFGRAKDSIANIRGAMRPLKLGRPLYRGMVSYPNEDDDDPVDSRLYRHKPIEYRAGDVVKTDSFMSTSLDLETADAFSYDLLNRHNSYKLLMEIHPNRRGTIRGVPTNPPEQEVIVDKGVEMTVIEVHPNVRLPNGRVLDQYAVMKVGR